MSTETNLPVDNLAGLQAPSTTVAPQSAGETPESTPAPVDTTASEAVPEGDTPEKRQSRRESRAFATQRREIRELYRQLGAMQERLSGQQPPAEGDQPNPRPVAAPADNRASAATAMAMERIEDTADEIDDIDGVIGTITARGFPISEPMRDFFAGMSEKPAHLAQYLAKNRQEAARISILSEGMAQAALERIEAKLTAAPKPPAKKVTGAPPPVSTVGGSSTASFDPQKAEMGDYEKWRRRQA